MNRKAGPHARFEEMTAQAVNQRAQTDVISRKAFPDRFRIGDRRSRTMPQVSRPAIVRKVNWVLLGHKMTPAARDYEASDCIGMMQSTRPHYLQTARASGGELI